MYELWLTGLTPNSQNIALVKLIRMIMSADLLTAKVKVFDELKLNGTPTKLGIADSLASVIEGSSPGEGPPITMEWALKELQLAGAVTEVRHSNPLAHKMKKVRGALAELQAVFSNDLVAQMLLELTILADSEGVEIESRP